MEVFVIIGAAGLVFLMASLVLDIDGDGDIEFGDLEIDADGPSWFSFRVLAASLIGLGASGVIATALGAIAPVAWLAALAGFFMTGFGSFQLVVKPLYRQQSNSLTSRKSYESSIATVILAIGPEQPGRVRFVDSNGATVEEVAFSNQDSVIPHGATVVIYEVQPHHVSVTPLNV